MGLSCKFSHHPILWKSSPNGPTFRLVKYVFKTQIYRWLWINTYLLPCLRGRTSINPSYFDVNKKGVQDGTGVWHVLTHCQMMIWVVMICVFGWSSAPMGHLWPKLGGHTMSALSTLPKRFEVNFCRGRISRSYVICKGKWRLNDNFSPIFFWRLWNFNSLIKTMDTSWEVEKNFSAILTNWSIWALSLIRFLRAMFGAPDVCWKTGTQNFQKERQPEGFHLQP